MTATKTNDDFRYYMHDGPNAFSFERAGALSDSAARELEQAWKTASSTAGGRSPIVDLSFVTRVDEAGRRMIRRWYDGGAQLVANRPPASMIVKSITGQQSDAVAEARHYYTWRPLQALLTLGLMLLLATAPAGAADLKPETVQAWQAYVETVNARNQQRLASEKCFLSMDEMPGRTARVRDGEIFVWPAGPRVPVKVPSGLIHDWMGAAFIPNAGLADVFHSVRDYSSYKEVYRPNVVDSRPAATSEWEDRFSLTLMNRSVVAKSALDTDYQSTFTRVDDRRWYSVTETTRIREIADYGAASERTLPEDEGSGLIWRLYSIARFEERDGGVYIEIEAVALSRDIPVALRWMIAPIVRRISRSSLLTSLQQTQEAVRSGVQAARGASEDSRSERSRSKPAASAVTSFR
jgi:hypothetical protein